MMGFTPLVTPWSRLHIKCSDDFQELQSLQTGGIFCCVAIGTMKELDEGDGSLLIHADHRET
jgi:hypothetical protein